MSEHGFTRRGLLARLAALPAAIVGVPVALARETELHQFEQKISGHLASSVSSLKQTLGPSGELILQQMVERAFARDIEANGPMAQRITRHVLGPGPVSVRLEQVNNDSVRETVRKIREGLHSRAARRAELEVLASQAEADPGV